jgi:thiol-disulfide isomerase/thioredoxin
MMRTPLRWVWLLTALVLFLAGCGNPDPPDRLLSQRQTDEPSVGLSKNDRAPDIEGEDADGKLFKLSDYRGKVVLLDFWGDWCPHCRAMIPHERKLVKRLEGKPFVLLGVNSDPERDDLKAVQTGKHITWRSWWDGQDGPIAEAYNVHSWPRLYLLDERRVIRWIGKGRPKDSLLDKVVDGLVKEVEEQGNEKVGR